MRAVAAGACWGRLLYWPGKRTRQSGPRRLLTAAEKSVGVSGSGASPYAADCGDEASPHSPRYRAYLGWVLLQY